MKVTGPRNVPGTSGARKKASGGASESTFSPGASSGSASTGASAPLSGASAVNSVDAVLALQSTGDFREAKKRATERALDLLDVLDDLKIALLEGGIPRDKLARLMDTLRTRRDATDDPDLEAALDEVELRAAVELAKYDA
ncbi:flagellar biosynthesis protein FlgI [Marinicauda salina]|uniref:Flagellar biosynthesis protein FlgI n=1 Tax=Marinicauda salina TaxID=2135793 RepID=A0A2U2BU78_9PROT|nr:flagellar assembly protein FliX [Marinicauda salina]PWE17558.1 flagellar biosynthesis protein FlgI [Marinicauda salina]